MHAFIQQSIEIDRERGNERLPFPRPHLGNRATMQNNATDHLDVKVTQTNGPFGGLTNRRESLRQDFVQRVPLSLKLLFLLQTFQVAYAFSNPCTEFIFFGAQGLIAQGLKFRLECINLFDYGSNFFNSFLVGVSPKEFDKTFQHDNPLRSKDYS